MITSYCSQWWNEKIFCSPGCGCQHQYFTLFPHGNELHKCFTPLSSEPSQVILTTFRSSSIHCRASVRARCWTVPSFFDTSAYMAQCVHHYTTRCWTYPHYSVSYGFHLALLWLDAVTSIWPICWRARYFSLHCSAKHVSVSCCHIVTNKVSFKRSLSRYIDWNGQSTPL